MTRVVFALAAAATVGGAYAAEDLTAQQQQTKDCNAQAKRKALVGGERQDFLANCLRSHGDEPPRFTAQQTRIVACNRQAREAGLRAAQRHEFMRECVKGDTAAAGGRR